MTTFPCTTAPALFDTMGGPDDPTVREAKALCLTCPAIFVCRQRGRDGGEWGVWGGESQVERIKATGQQDEDRPACGTYAALMLHRALLEKCEVCLAARRIRERAYDAKRREGKKLVREKNPKPRGGARVKAACPSPAAYKRHNKYGEDTVACGCRRAYNEARRAERKAAPKKERQMSSCPSSAAFKRHERNNESGIECGCKAAHLASEKDRREAKKKAKAGAAA